jgi:hypothetical protein
MAVFSLSHMDASGPETRAVAANFSQTVKTFNCVFGPQLNLKKIDAMALRT